MRPPPTPADRPHRHRPPARSAAALSLLATAALSLSACTSPEPIALTTEQLRQDRLALTDSRFAAADSIMEGFDIAASGEGWRPGDRVLLGVVFHRKGEEQVRFLKITLRGLPEEPRTWSYTYTDKGTGEEIKFESPRLATMITLYDADGRRLRNAPGSFPLLLLEHGLYGAAYAAATGSEALETLTPAQRADAVLGWLSLAEFGAAAGRNPLFRDMAGEIVRRPPLLSLLFGIRFELDLGPEGTSVADDVDLGESLPRKACRVQLDFKINDHLALRPNLLTTPPDAPLGLCDGLLALDAHNPDYPDNSIHLRLLAARRGEPPAPVNSGAQ